MNNILITGASGFIGSFMVDEALTKGYNVWAGVRKMSNKEFLKHEDIHFIDLNYSSVEKLKLQLDNFYEKNGNIDYIIHCAGVTKSAEQTDFEKINYGYTKNLLDSLKMSNHSLKKFLFVSSLSVMGLGDEEHFKPFDISDEENPNTAYGESKLKAERYIETNSFCPYIILRPTAVYGPREKDFLALVKIVSKGFAPMVGYKQQYPSFIFVKDLVNAAFLALESDVNNKKYLLTDACSYTDEEYLNLLREILGERSAVRVRVPLFFVKILACIGDLVARITKKAVTLNSDKYKILAQRNWNCNIAPIIDDLGFIPRYRLKEGLRKTINWYKENNWL